MFKNFSNNTRIAALSALLLVVVLLLGGMSINQQVNDSKNRIVETDLALRLASLGAKIDARVGQMKLISKSLANDKHIHAWVNGGFNAEQESILVEKLGFFVREYDLTSASFADKETHKYWNHEGFLRQLTPAIDTWYFAYLASGNQDLVSVYHDKNKKRVDLYVNYQQTNGNGLSGIATSFNGVLDMLNNSVFAEHGSVYLVDRSGKIQMQSDNLSTKLGEQVAKADEPQTLQLLFDESTVSKILSVASQQSAMSGSALSAAYMQENTAQFIDFANTALEKNNPHKGSLLGSSYIPSMDWFIVTHVPKDAFLLSLTGSQP